jgi:hypothetical protein
MFVQALSAHALYLSAVAPTTIANGAEAIMKTIDESATQRKSASK